MNKENTEKLLKDFPELYSILDDPKNSLMCFGFETGNGWYDLIYQLSEDITKYCSTLRVECPIVVQVKEKFGGLRFYISSGDKQITKFIERAEEKSYITCDVCGEPGKIRGRGWVVTRCEDHK
jgi:hypothetical protein